MSDKPGSRRRPPRNKGTPVARSYHELVRWAVARLREQLGPDTELPPLDLNIRVPLRASQADRRRAVREFQASLDRELSRVLRELGPVEQGFHDGHVWCHWCAAPTCDHSQPDSPREVFVGYEPTGKPRWSDFASWVVEQRDPRLDRLYEDQPAPLAVFTPGAALVRDLLADFGKRRTPYRIVGQLSCGLFPVRTRKNGERALAVSVQLIETRLPDGDLGFTLNSIAAPVDGADVGAVLDSARETLLGQYLRTLRSGVQQLRQQLSETRADGQRAGTRARRERALSFLERAPAQLDKAIRRSERRTQHAQTRTRDPGRPTASAFGDALGASAEDLYRDRQEHTIIVRGPHNRIHVFSDTGTHVTSIVYPGETIRERLRTRRWVPLSGTDADRLRERLSAACADPPGD